MDRDKAYEVATRMYQGEGERWVKNALGLLGALVSVFLVYHYILALPLLVSHW